MDTLPCHWNGASSQESFQKPRPIASTLSRLAELIARVEHKQDGLAPKPQQPSPAVCKDCGVEFPDLGTLGRHHQKEHALRKPHRCPQCGLEFALASSMQLHRCPDIPTVCQVCRGKPQWSAPCPSCLTQPLGPPSSEEPPQPHHLNHRLHHDGSPYACAPCGKAFGHKQELLYHQQAGDCEPAPQSPETLVHPPSPAPALSPDHTPTPSQASLPAAPSGTSVGPSACGLCLRTFRSAAGLACHRRLVHMNRWKKKKKKQQKSSVTAAECKEQALSFPCRSCDKVFSQTSTLYLHRKEEHRRETPVARQQRGSGKITRQRRKGETYPCLHCGKVFLHHLTRWAHFKNYSSHYHTHLTNSGKVGKTHMAGRAAKDLRETKTHKLGRPPKAASVLKSQSQKVRKHVTLRGKRLKGRTEEESVRQDEEQEFPCPSCAEVFSTQSSLRDHEEVHQSSVGSNHCSVCSRGISLPDTAGTRVYHCAPCEEAFVDLAAFLQHCQTHLHHSSDEDEEDSDQLKDD